MQADPADTAVSVLVCTAVQPLVEHHRVQSIAWGCEVLAKPFGIDELVPRIRACLNGSGVRQVGPISGGVHRAWTGAKAEHVARRDDGFATVLNRSRRTG